MVELLTRGVLCLVLVSVAGLVSSSAQGQTTPPPAAEVGTISGVVLDKTTGDPIIEAGVEVVGQGKTVRTDLDGRYTVRVPAGKYQLRIFAPLYQGTRLENVTVKPNEVTKADASLLSGGKAGVEVVEVVAQADRAAEATQLVKRKTAPVVSDIVSAEVIKKTPGSDAGDVVQRAPAVTVKDEKYVFVRGLGERYSSAVLNGSRLPSTDPERRVVPLDLFPAEFLESLTVIKSYTPDLPGDFSGGLVDLSLREFPEKLTLSFGSSIGFNTQTTFKDFNTYEGSSLDYVGFGEGFRQLPRDVPDNLNLLPPIRRNQVARSFKDIWAVDVEQAPPNASAGFSIGNSFGPLGLQLSVNYQNEYKRRSEIQRLLKRGDASDPVILAENFIFDHSTFQTRLGALFTSAYKLGTNHKFFFRSFLDQNSTDDVLITDGETTSFPGSPFSQTVFFYSQDQLAFGQLGGEHHFPWVQLDWRTAYAQTRQEQPDGRFQTRINGDFSIDSQGGLRVFNSLTERLTDSAVDFTAPFLTRLPGTDVWTGLPARFKFGPAYSFRDRDFAQRRFRYLLRGGVDPALPTEEILQPSNIAPGAVEMVEQTVPRDAFKATEEIGGGYGMFELPIVRDRLRVVGGSRMEYSLITVDTFETNTGLPVTIKKKNVDPLPGVNLIYSPRDDMNLRGSYGKSVSRPEFRELSPTSYPAPRGQREVIGNPELVQAAITSYDLRWEWFFSPLELTSLSFFYKQIDQPIERIILDQGGDTAESFANAQDATIIGFEFEGRKDFGFLSERLRPLSFLTNVTFAESEVNAPRTSKFDRQTSTNRPLQGQAPFIVNAALDYTSARWGTARLLYNTAGRRISTTGAFLLPDIFEERRNSVDAVFILPLREYVPSAAGFAVKLSIENILNDPQAFTQGDVVVQRYTTGVKFTLGVSYAY